MSATPNLKKSIVESLKERGVKATTTGKRAIAVDGRTIATAYDATRGLRLFVTDKRGPLPAKLASEFRLNQTRGYAAMFKPDDDLTPAVDAIAHVAALAPAARKSSGKPSTKSTRKPAAAKSGAKPKSSTKSSAKTTRAKSTAKPKSRKPTKRAASK